MLNLNEYSDESQKYDNEDEMFMDEEQEQDETSASGENSQKKRRKSGLLTTEEKKANHIASEQRRRQNIRVGYEKLIAMVPTLSENQRSEGEILSKSIEYIKSLIYERDELLDRIDRHNS